VSGFTSIATSSPVSVRDKDEVSAPPKQMRAGKGGIPGGGSCVPSIYFRIDLWPDSGLQVAQGRGPDLHVLATFLVQADKAGWQVRAKDNVIHPLHFSSNIYSIV